MNTIATAFDSNYLPAGTQQDGPLDMYAEWAARCNRVPDGHRMPTIQNRFFASRTSFIGMFVEQDAICQTMTIFVTQRSWTSLQTAEQLVVQDFVIRSSPHSMRLRRVNSKFVKTSCGLTGWQQSICASMKSRRSPFAAVMPHAQSIASVGFSSQVSQIKTFGKRPGFAKFELACAPSP